MEKIAAAITRAIRAENASLMTKSLPRLSKNLVEHFAA